MSAGSGHRWRFSKDEAELRSMKMENVICRVGFKGPFAEWEHGARLTEQRCDILGGHKLKFMATGFPTHCCWIPPGPGTCDEWEVPLSYAESWDKMSITSDPGYPIWSRNRDGPSMVLYLYGTDEAELSISSLALHINQDFFFCLWRFVKVNVTNTS